MHNAKREEASKGLSLNSPLRKSIFSTIDGLHLNSYIIIHKQLKRGIVSVTRYNKLCALIVSAWGRKCADNPRGTAAGGIALYSVSKGCIERKKARASRGRRQNLIAVAGASSEIGARGGFSSAPYQLGGDQ